MTWYTNLNATPIHIYNVVKQNKKYLDYRKHLGIQFQRSLYSKERIRDRVGPFHGSSTPLPSFHTPHYPLHSSANVIFIYIYNWHMSMLLKIMGLTSMKQHLHVKACIHYHRVERCCIVEEDIAYSTKVIEENVKDRLLNMIRSRELHYQNFTIRVDHVWKDNTKGHFTHKTESLWPLHFKHSRWRSRSKFASHYAWGTNGVCEYKMDVKSTWLPTWHQMDHVSWSVGLFSKSTSWR